MSKQLSRELQQLQQRVATMALGVKQSLAASIAALLNADPEAAQLVIENDQVINDQRYSLERESVAIIATQQPVAGNVRLLVGVLEIATELERMGDYAKDIARIAIRQAPHGAPKPLAELTPMADQAVGMLDRAVSAFVESNATLAKTVASEDDQIDAICETLHRRLMEHGQATENDFEDAVRLLPAVHNIERFADRATNICERVVYVVTGEQVEFGDP